jgi:hypothetical protein
MDDRPGHELTEAEVLAESLALHAAFWDALGELTSAQMRWRGLELELRTNMAANRETPVDWLVDEIRSDAGKHASERSGGTCCAIALAW